MLPSTTTPDTSWPLLTTSSHSTRSMPLNRSPVNRTEDPARSEHYFVYAHRDGLLLAFGTYDETRANGGKV